MKTAAEYRQFAAKCRELATVLSNPDDKRATVLMTSAWEKAAKQREVQLRLKQNNKNNY